MLRRALTLLELIVIIAIIAVLLALMLPALQMARESAARMRSANQLRQIGHAAHNYASVNGEQLPQIDRDRPSPLSALLLFTEYENLYRSSPAFAILPVRLFISPSDPTFSLRERDSVTSYAANATVFARPGNSMTTGFSDGTSQTIMFAEQYAVCNGSHNDIFLNSPYFFSIIRRASFADAELGDTVPVTSGAPPVSRPSRPGMTFQVKPTPATCNRCVAQTPHAGGMLALRADGSVGTLKGGMAEHIYWALVTPDGGEILDDH